AGAHPDCGRSGVCRGLEPDAPRPPRLVPGRVGCRDRDHAAGTAILAGDPGVTAALAGEPDPRMAADALAARTAVLLGPGSGPLLAGLAGVAPPVRARRTLRRLGTCLAPGRRPDAQERGAVRDDSRAGAHAPARTPGRQPARGRPPDRTRRHRDWGNLCRADRGGSLVKAGRPARMGAAAGRRPRSDRRLSRPALQPLRRWWAHHLVRPRQAGLPGQPT